MTRIVVTYLVFQATCQECGKLNAHTLRQEQIPGYILCPECGLSSRVEAAIVCTPRSTVEAVVRPVP